MCYGATLGLAQQELHIHVSCFIVNYDHYQLILEFLKENKRKNTCIIKINQNTPHRLTQP